MLKSLFLLTLLFLTLPASSYAFGRFIKNASNPLPFTLEIDNWNENWRVQPSVIFENGFYKMWYASFNGENFKVAYAESENGETWERKQLFDLVDGKDTHDPSILKKDDRYFLVFASSKGGKDYKIHLVDSTLQNNFLKESVREILKPEESWEIRGISAPYLFFENDTYLLFYSAWNTSGWKVALATSTDTDTWHRCQTNPIIPFGDGPTIIRYNDLYYLFTHMPDGSGIKYYSSSGPLGCNSTWKEEGYALRPDTTYDQRHITSPSLLLKPDGVSLYYSGLSQDVNWYIHQADSLFPVNNNLIVIIPGFMASWNREAVLHNKAVPYNEWHLLPFIKEYDGLVNTFNNLGKKEGKDFLIFPYDWRKNLENSASELNRFLETNYLHKNPDAKINIIGHSLGGLVGRFWAQKYGEDLIDKLITVGSPHLGVAQTYKPLEAGEIERENSLLWLMEKLILALNNTSFPTSRESLHEHLPVLYDLFPVYDFLKDSTGFLPVNELTVKNITLVNNNQSLPLLYPKLTTIIGEAGNTLSGFVIGERTITDKLLNLYPDGRPKDSLYENGDFTVIGRSARIMNNSFSFPLSHGEVIYKKPAIKQILSSLKIDFDESQISEGAPTQISPSLIFLLKSPVKLEVIAPDGRNYQEFNGIIFIENALDGIYQIRVLGVENGQYTLYIGQIVEKNDVWNSLVGKITKNPPGSQVDTYYLNFDKMQPQDFPLNKESPLSLFDIIITELSVLNETQKNKDLVDAVNDLKRAKIYFTKNKPSSIRKELLKTIQELFDARNKLDFSMKNSLYQSVKKVEKLYELSFKQKFSSGDIIDMKRKLDKLRKRGSSLEQSLLSKKYKGVNVTQKSSALLLLHEKIEIISNSINSNPQYSAVLFETTRQLIDEID